MFLTLFIDNHALKGLYNILARHAHTLIKHIVKQIGGLSQPLMVICKLHYHADISAACGDQPAGLLIH